MNILNPDFWFQVFVINDQWLWFRSIVPHYLIRPVKDIAILRFIIPVMVPGDQKNGPENIFEKSKLFQNFNQKIYLHEYRPDWKNVLILHNNFYEIEIPCFTNIYFNNWKNSNALQFLNSYALKGYEARRRNLVQLYARPYAIVTIFIFPIFNFNCCKKKSKSN